ncbi:hypothetical protein VNO80_22181 [Phaseolus coccineus]|uniref:Uncharacterized protein n=1 Tax=Phaseolus coccineus TaxID=3886 RepID=A0AAN9QU12_PHACN
MSVDRCRQADTVSVVKPLPPPLLCTVTTTGKVKVIKLKEKETNEPEISFFTEKENVKKKIQQLIPKSEKKQRKKHQLV